MADLIITGHKILAPSMSIQMFVKCKGDTINIGDVVYAADGLTVTNKNPGDEISQAIGICTGIGDGQQIMVVTNPGSGWDNQPDFMDWFSNGKPNIPYIENFSSLIHGETFGSYKEKSKEEFEVEDSKYLKPRKKKEPLKKEPLKRNLILDAGNIKRKIIIPE